MAKGTWAVAVPLGSSARNGTSPGSEPPVFQSARTVKAAKHAKTTRAAKGTKLSCVNAKKLGTKMSGVVMKTMTHQYGPTTQSSLRGCVCPPLHLLGTSHTTVSFPTFEVHGRQMQQNVSSNPSTGRSAKPEAGGLGAFATAGGFMRKLMLSPVSSWLYSFRPSKACYCSLRPTEALPPLLPGTCLKRTIKTQTTKKSTGIFASSWRAGQ